MPEFILLSVNKNVPFPNVYSLNFRDFFFRESFSPESRLLLCFVSITIVNIYVHKITKVWFDDSIRKFLEMLSNKNKSIMKIDSAS